MAEYIEREAFIEDIKTEITNLKMNGLKGTPRPCEELYDFIDRINEQPTADVAEVRHGKVLQLDHDEWWGAVYKCCECGEEFMLGNSKRALCCPYCGVYLSVRGEGE